jgi:hypothetical protein
MSRAATASAALWDEVWAEYDARQRRRAAASPTPARPRADWLGELVNGPAAPPRAAARSETPARPRRRPWGLLALGATAALAAYAASPLAAAVQVASAVQRADATALTAQADWERLRPGIEARLEAMAAQRLDGAPPAFVRQMQGDLAARLASPQGFGALVGGSTVRGEAPAREWLQGAQPREGGRWNVTLARPEAPGRTATLTLELQDPLRLRWQVVDVAW